MSEQQTTTPLHAFPLCYDAFGKELVAKVNERFSRTAAEIIPHVDSPQTQIHILRRLAMVTVLSQDPTLQSHHAWPITPAQFETLFHQAYFQHETPQEEHLALLRYDRNFTSDGLYLGSNPYEGAQFSASLRNNLRELGLSQDALEQRLLVIHAGLEKDTNSHVYGVVPVVLPGVTQVIPLACLQETARKFFRGQERTVGYFTSASDHGLPTLQELIKDARGAWPLRSLDIPHKQKNLGLRVLKSNRFSGGIIAWDDSLVQYPHYDLPVTFLKRP